MKMQAVSPLQKDAARALVVAVSSRAVFGPAADDGDDVYGEGEAFPLLQVRVKNLKKCLQVIPDCASKA